MERRKRLGMRQEKGVERDGGSHIPSSKSGAAVRFLKRQELTPTITDCHLPING